MSVFVCVTTCVPVIDGEERGRDKERESDELLSIFLSLSLRVCGCVFVWV